MNITMNQIKDFLTEEQIEAFLSEVKRIAKIVRPEVEKELAKKAGVTVGQLRMVLEIDEKKREFIENMAEELAITLMSK